MRVSTAQFYLQNSQKIGGLQSQVNQQSDYLSTGKRIITAKDDAVAFGTLAGYKDELMNIEKYQRNITQAKNRNSLQDTSFDNAQTLMQELKRIFIQANNGTLDDDDLKSLAELASNSQSQMLDIANTKDETGGYIFAGYQIDKQPFALQPDNSVNYLGDNGVRQLQIAKNVMVDTNQPGDEAFEKVANAIGDFKPNYIANTSGVSVNSALINDSAVYDSVAHPPGYRFVFTAPSDLTVTDANTNVVYPTAPYTPGQIVAFNGVEVQLDGNPLPGDELVLEATQNISIFDTIKSAVDWMNVGTGTANVTQHQVDYNEILTQLDRSLNHMTTRQTDAGIRVQLIETQSENHKDKELTISKSQSNIEDLDFAKAIANFEQSKVALQAAQQTFVQVKNLNLFNYI
ncbi:flagellar hook-associated protein FlgL [Pseudocolwellia agarivorans]|uniref:flagellar hook-associated protein FlgL n=1 Tax=Pseudocolwellia agarivorans TaxID=1911682 RepID=UPI000987AE16|nr:flagellar hook-associated protein FlgL [Pseudocolwellia agarivorans]